MPVLLSATAIYDSQGNYQTNRATIFDITERKQADEMLRRQSEEIKLANAALEKAARHKDEFLASMSHELRTPLTGVLSLSEALLEQVYGALNEKQLRILHRIEESGQHLLDLINDILDLSKVESGQMELQIGQASVSDICQSALQLTKGMANKKRHTVSFSMNPVSISIDADSRRLKQMLVNLLSNAVKFTPDGGKIGLEVRGNETDHIISFSVTDTGIGIAPEMFSMLFKPFVQLDSSLSRQYAGTGLGLSLIQRMAELHGGSVSLDSELGKGSRFTISLPWTTSIRREREDDTVSDAEKLPKALILLVEDNDINIGIYSEYLRIKAYRVAVAKNGRDGIEKARKLQPDLILMDIQMPGMDGLEAICILRSDKNSRLASVPIIALTSLEVPGDRKQCLASGANEYLSKPVPLDVLLKTIERYLFP
jgi:signal transduction histidine kinase/ActR/RegA family two-component response regulator